MKFYHRRGVAACLALLAFKTSAAVLCVDVNGINPAPPYTSWATAATNIQDAVDTATNGDLILVTNGVYQNGSGSLDGFTTNRVAVTNSLTLRSINGPAVTVIDGSGAMRCVSLADGATLDGFTLQNGMVAANGGGVAGDTTNALVINCIITQNTADYGGGIFQCTASRCIISTNSAYYNGYYGTGGGANGSILNDCLLEGNFGYEYGGAAVNTTMNNCTVTGNHSRIYPSTFDNCIINNCIVYFNYGVFYVYDGQLVPVYFTYNGGSGTYDHCCITPDPGGTGNITDDPLFVDAANGDFHLQTGSPCINAGNNDLTPTATDLDGVIRIQGGTVDIGAYESPGYVIPILYFTADRTNVVPGYPISFSWRLFFTNSPVVLLDYGDGTVVTNAVSGTEHSWSAPGNYTVQLIALSSDYPSGTNASIAIHIADATNYVSLACTNPVPPYNSWVTAATNIQDAVDVAVLGATVMVGNGVYDVGGRGLTSLTNRVLIPIQLAVKSVNGPAVTTIVGNQVPGTINDFGAVRCVYLADGATLSGFTLTNGATEPGNDDGVYESYGGGVECGSSYSTVTNCVFINNSAGDAGGGVAGGTLNNCTFVGNQSGYGGGAYNAWLNNCVLAGNPAGVQGGGAEYCTLNNCTLTGNSAGSGGGADSSTLNNCIVCFNSGPSGSNYSSCTLNFCCTTPLPESGTNNITTDPQLADFSHITTGSPCRAAGSTNYSTGMDIDNEAWASPPSIGCDEFHPGAITGPLTVAMQVSYTNVARGFVVNFTGLISGHAGSNTWDFGDGTGMNNQPYTSHGWAALGDYPVILRVYNESYPDGVSATQVVHVLEAIHYVAPNNTSPVSPYTSWDTAATNIQDAVDAAFPGGTILVTNGVYGNGGRIVFGTLTNRVVINRQTAVTVESVNGPEVTVVQGYQDPVTINGDDAVRCVLLSNGSRLVGFTLTGGATRNDGDGVTEQSGGGLWCDSTSVVASNCVLTGNSAAWTGGGASGGTLNNCAFIGNSASYGGGVYQDTLSACTLSNNSAANYGGATYNSVLTNCVLSGNSAGGVGGAVCYGTANHCTLAGNLTGDSGGAACGATLNDCLLASNSAFYTGGGANSCFLTNCALSGNSAYWGGGAGNSTLQSCVLSGNTSALNGGGTLFCTMNHCTLSGNSSSWGGGASDSTLDTCTLSNNFAVLFDAEGGVGGGAAYCNFVNCVLAGNSAEYIGGGADSSTLNNCTLAGNSASSSGGGASDSTLNNCIVYFNTAPDGTNFAPPTEYYYGCTLNYCCTTPMPDVGVDNFTNAPLVADPIGGDFHLQSNSPCINAGNNAYVSGTNDLDGNPRIKGGTVDIGAYEYQTPTSVISYAWLQQYGLTNDGSADYADADGDGMNNWQEWRTGTIPTDPSSLLKMTTVTTDVSGNTVTWQSVSGVTYFLQRGSNLAAPSVFTTIQTDIAGQPDTTSYTDADAVGSGPFFYRVGVQQ